MGGGPRRPWNQIPHENFENEASADNTADTGVEAGARGGSARPLVPWVLCALMVGASCAGRERES